MKILRSLRKLKYRSDIGLGNGKKGGSSEDGVKFGPTQIIKDLITSPEDWLESMGQNWCRGKSFN